MNAAVTCGFRFGTGSICFEKTLASPNSRYAVFGELVLNLEWINVSVQSFLITIFV